MTATSISEEIRRYWDDDATSYDTSPSHYPRRPQRWRRRPPRCAACCRPSRHGAGRRGRHRVLAPAAGPAGIPGHHRGPVRGVAADPHLQGRPRGLDIRRTARSCNARAEHAIMRHRAKGKLTVDMWCIVGIYLERVSGCRRRAVSRRVVTWCEEQTHLTLGFRSIAGIRSWPSLRVSARPGGAR